MFLHGSVGEFVYTMFFNSSFKPFSVQAQSQLPSTHGELDFIVRVMAATYPLPNEAVYHIPFQVNNSWKFPFNLMQFCRTCDWIDQNDRR